MPWHPDSPRHGPYHVNYRSIRAGYIYVTRGQDIHQIRIGLAKCYMHVRVYMPIKSC